MNNAAYWAAVEEWLDGHPRPEPFTASVEYAAGIEQGATVDVAWAATPTGAQLWWLAPDGTVLASAGLASAGLASAERSTGTTSAGRNTD